MAHGYFDGNGFGNGSFVPNIPVIPSASTSEMYNPAKTYQEGKTVVYGSPDALQLYIANKFTSGEFNPDDWDLVNDSAGIINDASVSLSEVWSSSKVAAEIASGSAYTFSNALTESGGNVKWGGNLTQHVEIGGDSGNYAIQLGYNGGNDPLAYFGVTANVYGIYGGGVNLEMNSSVGFSLRSSKFNYLSFDTAQELSFDSSNNFVLNSSTLKFGALAGYGTGMLVTDDYGNISALPYTYGTVTEVSGTTNRITVATGTSTPVIDISGSYVGQSSITTLGTVSTGTWNATAIGVSKGGTGLTALGTANQLLRVNSGATALEYFTPSFLTAALTSLGGLTGATQTFATGTSGTDFGISSSGTVHTFNLPTASASNRGLLSSTDWNTFNDKMPAMTGGVAGQVRFDTGASTTSSSSGLFWDTTNSRLGIGTGTPSARLHSLATTEQLRLSYDASFSASFTVSSTGALTIAPTNGIVNITSNLYTTGQLSTNGTGLTIANFAVGAAGSASATTTVSQVVFGGAGMVNYRVLERGSSSSTVGSGNSYGSHIIGNQTVGIASAGAHNIFAQLVIKALTINTGAGTLASSASLYIEAAASNATNNYAFWSAAGTNRLGGTTILDTLTGSGTGIVTADASGTLARIANNFLVNKTTTPTIAAGSGAGTGASVSITGTDTRGRVSVTTAGTPAASAVLVTVTFNTAYAAAPKVFITPNNTNAALSLASFFVQNESTTGFEIAIDTSALTTGLVFNLNYFVCP